MRYTQFSTLATMAVVLMGGVPAADAGVIVTIVPDDQTVNIDEQFEVSIYASMSEPVVGWGMVFTIEDPAIIAHNGIPMAAAPWFDTTQQLGDDWLLGGLAFPNPINGPDILLVTLSFTATAFGETDLLLSINPESLRQGFALGPPWSPGTFDFVQINNGHVNVIPAPGALFMVALTGLWARRARRSD